MKKLVVIATGWHFSLHFYKRMMEQSVPDDWKVEYVCISHRDPEYAVGEKQNVGGKSIVQRLDAILYEKIATQEDIEQLGWTYMLEPNTIGDWGCANQWLEKKEQEYDVLLITHDDNFIVGNDIFEAVLEGKIKTLYHNDYERKESFQIEYNDDWLVITNAFIKGRPHLRGSFDFFTKEMMNLIGGTFDLSRVNLTRIGQFDTPKEHNGIAEWNNHVTDFLGFLLENKLFDRVYCLADTYRVSDYCIEGERGFISKYKVLPHLYLKAIGELCGRRTVI
jgi:hypothetical protein